MYKNESGRVTRYLVPLLMILGGLCSAGRALGSIAYIQGNSQVNSSASSVTAAYTAAQVAGDLNVVIVGWCDDTSSVQSVTDTSGNTYTLAAGPTISSGNATQSIYYAPNIAASAAGANSVTVTFNAAACYPDLRVAEYNGIATSNPVDAAAGAVGSSTSLASAVTTLSANDLLVSGDYTYGVTLTAGAAPRIFDEYEEILQDQIASTPGSYTATAAQDQSGFWVMQVVAFKAANPSASVDTQPPSTPTGFTATAVGTTVVELSWSASTDNVGVTDYVVEGCDGAGCSNFALVAIVPPDYSLEYSNTSAGNYQVQAVDAAGNLSGAATVSFAGISGSSGGSSSGGSSGSSGGSSSGGSSGSSGGSSSGGSSGSSSGSSSGGSSGSSSGSGSGSSSGSSGGSSSSGGGGTTYTYDANGRVVQVTTAGGATTTYTYDAAGHLVNVQITP